jgi:hypothetical protein
MNAHPVTAVPLAQSSHADALVYSVEKSALLVQLQNGLHPRRPMSNSVLQVEKHPEFDMRRLISQR